MLKRTSLLVYAVMACLFIFAGAQTRTEFIQALIKDYDHRIPPDFERNFPTDVNVSLHINSIDSINEQTMDFTVNALIQQDWVDSRLQFYGLIDAEYLELDSKLLKEIWVPDLYFTNEKKATFHEVTVPNRMLHLYSDGHITYRIRVSVTASCPMYLQNYPMDKQICSLLMQSFAYTTNTLRFYWLSENPVVINKDLELPQFSVETVKATECMDPEEKFTCIQMKIVLARNLGFYMIQIYIPTILIVLLSWVSFWLSIDAVPARISLGILTVLTMTTQKTTAIASLPRVSYVKAIDIWMAACLVFVFAALLEFAVVNVMQRRKPRNSGSEFQFMLNTDLSHKEVMNRSVSQGEMFGKKRAKDVDNISRIVFPLVFVAFCTIYWLVYTTGCQLCHVTKTG